MNEHVHNYVQASSEAHPPENAHEHAHYDVEKHGWSSHFVSASAERLGGVGHGPRSVVVGGSLVLGDCGCCRTSDFLDDAVSREVDADADQTTDSSKSPQRH
ncbi:MAG: hypothetical protein ABIQ14_04260 [Candidatus Saccharimonadales bacterium]